MTAEPNQQPKDQWSIDYATHPDFGATIKMIRLDAPELLAMVEALRAMRDMAKIGKPMVATEIMAAADQAAAAITAWEKLTK